MHTRRIIRCSLILALAAVVLPGLARGASRVLVVPFAIHAAEDLSFLQKGISAMLATRLADGDKVAVVGPGEAEAALAGLQGTLTAAQARAAGEKAIAAEVARMEDGKIKDRLLDCLNRIRTTDQRDLIF